MALDGFGADPFFRDKFYGGAEEVVEESPFLVRDGEPWTPSALNVLEGLTRKSVFDIAVRLDNLCREATLTR